MRASESTNSDDENSGPTGPGEHDRVQTTGAQEVERYIEALGGSTTVATLQEEIDVSKPRLTTLLEELRKENRIDVATGYSAVRVSIVAGSIEGAT